MAGAAPPAQQGAGGRGGAGRAGRAGAALGLAAAAAALLLGGGGPPARPGGSSGTGPGGSGCPLGYGGGGDGGRPGLLVFHNASVLTMDPEVYPLLPHPPIPATPPPARLSPPRHRVERGSSSYPPSLVTPRRAKLNALPNPLQRPAAAPGFRIYCQARARPRVRDPCCVTHCSAFAAQNYLRSESIS